jgi:nicotinamidase-related amidase
MPSFDPATTALILIDLQNGIVGMDLAPRSGAQVVESAKAFAAKAREAELPVILVHVGFAADGADKPSLNVDKPSLPPTIPPEWSAFVDGLKQDGDLTILKHHWGAFTGTDLDLDLQLRRRGVKTILLGGIATNFGVESTARSAWELGYDLVILEDLCTSRKAEMHEFAMANIFPGISRVMQAGDIELI